MYLYLYDMFKTIAKQKLLIYFNISSFCFAIVLKRILLNCPINFAPCFTHFKIWNSRSQIISTLYLHNKLFFYKTKFKPSKFKITIINNSPIKIVHQRFVQKLHRSTLTFLICIFLPMSLLNFYFFFCDIVQLAFIFQYGSYLVSFSFHNQIQ